MRSVFGQGAISYPLWQLFDYGLAYLLKNLTITFVFSELLVNMRQLGDLAYSDLLSRIRIGQHTSEDLDVLSSRFVEPGFLAYSERIIALT